MAGNKVSLSLVSAVLLVAGAVFYIYMQIPACLACAAFLAVFYFYAEKEKYSFSAKEEKKLYAALFFFSAIMLLFRFYRITSFPYDYYSDEWTGIIDSFFKMQGREGFFSYFRRSGAALPYIPNAVYTLFLVLFGHKIEFMRFIPLLLVLATAAELFFLGRRIKDVKLGIILVFVYSCSGWTLFLSRILVYYIYLPFLAVSFLLLFLGGLEKNGILKFCLAWAVFAAGFFCQLSWVIMTPFALYLIYEYRDKLGSLKAAAALFIITVITAASLTAYFMNKGAMEWAFSMSALGGADAAIKLVLNLRHIPEFFMIPVGNSSWYSNKLPLLNFVEFLLISGGLALSVSKIKQKSYRIFLAGFCLSLFSLVISTSIDHHARHVMILPFLTVLSGLFMRQIIGRRYSVFIVAMSAAFFINAALYFFIDWNNSLQTSTDRAQISDYINKNIGDSGFLFMYNTKPHGEYEAYLRSGIAYKKNSHTGISRVVFTTSSHLRRRIREIFPGIKYRYFYDYGGGKSLPTVLYELDLADNEPVKRYFTEMSGRLDEANFFLWKLEYGEAIKICEKYCVNAEKNAELILKNTFLRYAQMKAYEVLDQGGEIARVLLDRKKPMFLTSDWYLRIGEAFYNKGDFKNAVYFVREAVLAEPEWETAKKALKTLKKQEMP